MIANKKRGLTTYLFISALIVSFSFLSLFYSSTVVAEGTLKTDKLSRDCSKLKNANNKECNPSDNDSDSVATGGSCKNGDCDSIKNYLINATNLLSAIVGIVVVAAIVIDGIRFSISSGDPQKAASAKKHMVGAIVALVAFFLLWAFLNFIIPGGLLNG